MIILTNTDIVKTAVKICNEDEFKRDIFSGVYTDQEEPRNRKNCWNKKVQNKALSLLKAYNLDKNQKKIIVGAVMSIALRMLTWIEYYIGTFTFPRDFCIEFLETSLFTSEGIMDSSKVAIKMSGETLSNLQDFQLASFYCQSKRIPKLFENLSKENKNLVYNENDPQLIRQPDIIKFWSYFYKGEIDKLQGGIAKIELYRLKTAIYSGSQLAVEFCIKTMRQSYLVDTAVSVVIYRMQRELRTEDPNSNFVYDWVVFRNRNYSCQEDSWTPDCFITDIFYSLLSKMSDSQKIVMIRRVFEGVNSETFGKSNYIKVLEHFLCWPYQNQFLALVKLSWEHLPKRAYGGLLLEIVNRIEPKVDNFWCGEEKICDYKKLLMDVWLSSPSDFKRYVFSDKIRKFQNKDDPEGKIILKEGKELLLRMFQLHHFPEGDRRNVISIIESLTQNEKEYFLSSSEGAMVCDMLIKKGLDDVFEELVTTCCELSESIQDFRKRISLEFVVKGKFSAALMELILINPSAADCFVRLCIHPEESKSFKKSLLFSEVGINMCQSFLRNGITVFTDKLINWCLSSQDEINKFKETLALRTEISYNCNYNLEDIERCSVEELPNLIIDWESSKTFLSWCFQSESETNSFKRKFLKNSKEKIILKCIALDKWNIADKFFSCLNLLPDEEKNMKKELFFTSSSINHLFDDLMACNENDQKFLQNGGKQQAIERFLCWFLVDEESIKEFAMRYKCYRTDIGIQNIIKAITFTLF